MRETQATRALCRRLQNECGARIISLVGGQKQTPGIPDRYIAHPVWSGWIEFKGAKTTTTKLQTEWIRWLNVCGANAWIVRFVPTNRLQIEDHDGAVYGTVDSRAPREFLETLKALSDGRKNRISV